MAKQISIIIKDDGNDKNKVLFRLNDNQLNSINQARFSEGQINMACFKN